MSTEPDSLVLHLLRDMRADMQDMRANMQDMRANMATRDDIANMATKGDIAELRSGIRDVASDLLVTRKELSDQIVGLRRAMVDYHTTVVGHASLITELEARLRRVELHLNLPAPDTH